MMYIIRTIANKSSYVDITRTLPRFLTKRLYLMLSESIKDIVKATISITSSVFLLLLYLFKHDEQRMFLHIRYGI